MRHSLSLLQAQQTPTPPQSRPVCLPAGTRTLRRIAVIDQFSVAHGGIPGVRLLEIQEPTRFETFIAVKRGAPLSPYATHFIETLRAEMEADGKLRPARTARK